MSHKINEDCERRISNLEELTQKHDRAYYLIVGGWATIMAVFGFTRILLEFFKR